MGEAHGMGASSRDEVEAELGRIGRAPREKSGQENVRQKEQCK